MLLEVRFEVVILRSGMHKLHEGHGPQERHGLHMELSSYLTLPFYLMHGNMSLTYCTALCYFFLPISLTKLLTQFN